MNTSEPQVFKGHLIPGFQLYILGMAVLVAGGLLLGILIYASQAPETATRPAFWWAIASVVFSLLVFMPLIFAKTVMTVGDTTVRVECAWLSRTEFSLGDIEFVEEGPVTGISLGLGSRVLGSAHTGYLTGGYSVNFHFKDGKTITVSCDDPDAALAAVRQAAGGHLAVQRPSVQR